MLNYKLTLSLGIVSVLVVSILMVAAAEKKVDVSKLPPPSDKQGVTYAKDIKPIFEKSCIKCHGPEKQKSKLRLDSLAAAVKGGENGPDIIPGKSAESTLIHNIAHIGDED